MAVMFVWTALKGLQGHKRAPGGICRVLFTSFLGAELLSERMYRSPCPSGLSAALQIKEVFLKLGDLKCPGT